MKPSDLFWEQFEGETRGEVQQILADLVLQKAITDNTNTNGIIIDALEAALDYLYKDSLDELKEHLDELKED